MGVYGAPETFLLDAQGQVVYKRVGDINPRIWRSELAPRLLELGSALPREKASHDVRSIRQMDPQSVNPSGLGLRSAGVCFAVSQIALCSATRCKSAGTVL